MEYSMPEGEVDSRLLEGVYDLSRTLNNSQWVRVQWEDGNWHSCSTALHLIERLRRAIESEEKRMTVRMLLEHVGTQRGSLSWGDDW